MKHETRSHRVDPVFCVSFASGTSKYASIKRLFWRYKQKMVTNRWSTVLNRSSNKSIGLLPICIYGV